MLDLDKGTYPFVTSSNPVTGYALASAGIGPREVERVIGITKAYVTRVGAGPFPTEDHGPGGDRLGERGQEFGTVTGRKRRCGWFDAVILRYAARVNGLTELFVTKLDVLSGFETVQVCTAYRAEGETFDDVPPHQSLFHKAEPVYEELEGWDEEIGAATLVRRPARGGAQVPRADPGARRRAGRRGLGRSGPRAEPDRGRRMSGPGDGVPPCRAMRVLVVGAGGREHALAWRLAANPRSTGVLAAPGNAGIAREATCFDVAADDVDGLLALVERERVDLTVVGPEGPLVAGLADELAARGHPVFGPSARARGSRAPRRGRRTCASGTGSRRPGRLSVSTMSEALDALDAFGPPYVVKVDGLAAGKGVVITEERDEAVAGARARPRGRGEFGDAGSTVVVEEHLEGREVSAFALADGATALPLGFAQDFKRVGDDDAGPNTGGMGAYSPLPFVDDAIAERIRTEILDRTVRAMAAEGVPYRGVLYAGLMLTDAGPEGARVQLPVRRPGDPGPDAAAPVRARRAAPRVRPGHLGNCRGGPGARGVRDRRPRVGRLPRGVRDRVRDRGSRRGRARGGRDRVPFGHGGAAG